MEKTWYRVSTGAEKLGIVKNKEYNAYFLSETDAIEYSEPWRPHADIEKIKNPSHLEYLAYNENNELKASFKFKSHAIKFNGEKLNGKGHSEQSF